MEIYKMTIKFTILFVFTITIVACSSEEQINNKSLNSKHEEIYELSSSTEKELSNFPIEEMSVRILEILNEYPSNIISNMNEEELTQLIKEIIIKEFEVNENNVNYVFEELIIYINQHSLTTLPPQSNYTPSESTGNKKNLKDNDNRSYESNNFDSWEYDGNSTEELYHNGGISGYGGNGTDHDFDNDGSWDYDKGGTDRDLDNDGSWDYDKGGIDRDLDNDGSWDYDKGGIDRDLDNDGSWDY